MESLQSIKQRLKSVANIGKITKAMELVAATKMRRAQEIALSSRPYVYAALEMLANIERRTKDGALPELLVPRPVKKTAYVLTVSDKGLTGSFNTNVFRAFEKATSQNAVRETDESERGIMQEKKGKAAYIAVGEKARAYLERRRFPVAGSFSKFGDYTSPGEVAPLADFLIEGYRKGDWDRVVIFYTNFKSALVQEVVRREILPVSYESLKETARNIIPQTGRFAELLGQEAYFADQKKSLASFEYLIEPSPEEALRMLVPHLVKMQVYNIILEANASEHASRRVAMKNASDNADDIKGSLTIEYNKSRQGIITREIIEITAGAEAIQK